MALQIKMGRTGVCTRQKYKPVSFWPLPDLVVLDFLLSQTCCSCGYINKTQPNYAQASLLNFIGLWDVRSGKTQPVETEQIEAAGGTAASAG